MKLMERVCRWIASHMALLFGAAQVAFVIWLLISDGCRP